MIHNQDRVGNFTSSKIVALLSMGSREMTEDELAAHKNANPKSRKKTIESWPGKAALTYIDEKKMERRLGRSLSTEVNARATSWGSLVESRVFDLLGLEYSLTSKETIVHPDYPFWAGSPDAEKRNTAPDFKCPLTLKSFCQLVDPIYNGLTGMDAINAVRETHEDGETYYWQIVSNACIKGYQFGELIVYMPYLAELLEIKEMARRDGSGKYKWIEYAEFDELPYLLPNGYYKNLNVIRFEIPKADKDLLTVRVEQAGKLFLPADSEVLSSIIHAHHDAELNATIVEDATT
jgi:hypothetical protein